MPLTSRTTLALALLVAPAGFAEGLYGILGVGPTGAQPRYAHPGNFPAPPPVPVPSQPEEYDGTVRTDDAQLEALLNGPQAWRFMAEGEASNYWQDAVTTTGESFSADDVSAAVLGWFHTRRHFVYLPKPFPRGQGYPLLVVYEHEGARHWMFVRLNDRGPYTGATIVPVNREHRRAMGEGPRVRLPRPDPDRPIDLSAGAMRALFESIGKRFDRRQGLLHGVRVYLPPSELLPENDPRTGSEGPGASGYTIRSMVDEALERWPPRETRAVD